MRALAALLLVSFRSDAYAAQGQSGRGEITIQVTDDSWIPRPGVDLTVTLVSECRRGERRPLAAPVTVRTDAAGRAVVPVTALGSYLAQARALDGTAPGQLCAFLSKEAPSYALHLFARGVDAPQVELRMPSTATSRAEMRAWAVSGTYESADGPIRVFTVGKGDAIEVELPSLERLRFQRGNGWRFTSASGHVDFVRKGADVVGLIMSNEVSAKRSY